MSVYTSAKIVAFSAFGILVGLMVLVYNFASNPYSVVPTNSYATPMPISHDEERSVVQLTTYKTVEENGHVVSVEGNFCTGALIDSRRVLTAGHCFLGKNVSENQGLSRAENGDAFAVRLVSQPDGDRAFVTRVTPHFSEDSAVLELDRDVGTVDNVASIGTFDPSKPVTTLGWKDLGNGERKLVTNTLNVSPWSDYGTGDSTPQSEGEKSYGRIGSIKLDTPRNPAIAPGDSGSPFFQDGAVVGSLGGMHRFRPLSFEFGNDDAKRVAGIYGSPVDKNWLECTGRFGQFAPELVPDCFGK